MTKGSHQKALIFILALAMLSFSLGHVLAQTAKTQTANSDWLSYGGEPEQDHYSPLAQINRSNVSHLQLAWTYDTGEAGGKAHNRSLETRYLVLPPW